MGVNASVPYNGVVRDTYPPPWVMSNDGDKTIRNVCAEVTRSVGADISYAPVYNVCNHADTGVTLAYAFEKVSPDYLNALHTWWARMCDEHVDAMGISESFNEFVWRTRPAEFLGYKGVFEETNTIAHAPRKGAIVVIYPSIDMMHAIAYSDTCTASSAIQTGDAPMVHVVTVTSGTYRKPGGEIVNRLCDEWAPATGHLHVFKWDNCNTYCMIGTQRTFGDERYVLPNMRTVFDTAIASNIRDSRTCTLSIALFPATVDDNDVSVQKTVVYPGNLRTPIETMGAFVTVVMCFASISGISVADLITMRRRVLRGQTSEIGLSRKFIDCIEGMGEMDTEECVDAFERTYKEMCEARPREIASID